ncbi:hypothetical protein JNW90_33580 [Micromonospora sp. STR1s_5]|nr:hypothetical protein [Micromonospora sp. STR1s_5]
MDQSRTFERPPTAKDFDERCVTHISDQLDESAVTITLSDPMELVALARHQPVLAAREAQAAMTTLDVGFNSDRNGLIGAAYASAFHMMRTDGAWEHFIKDPGWGGLSRLPRNSMGHRNRMLGQVLRYVFRAEGEQARRRVRVYASALQHRFDKGCKPDEVASVIRRVGIEELRRQEVARRKAEHHREAPHAHLQDLNDLAHSPSVPRPEQQKKARSGLTPAQIAECLTALNAVNRAVATYLAQRIAKPAGAPLQGWTGRLQVSDDARFISSGRR